MWEDGNKGIEEFIQMKNQGSGIRQNTNYYYTKQKVILGKEKNTLQSRFKVAINFNSYIGVLCRISLEEKSCIHW